MVFGQEVYIIDFFNQMKGLGFLMYDFNFIGYLVCYVDKKDWFLFDKVCKMVKLFCLEL